MAETLQRQAPPGPCCCCHHPCCEWNGRGCDDNRPPRHSYPPAAGRPVVTAQSVPGISPLRVLALCPTFPITWLGLAQCQLFVAFLCRKLHRTVEFFCGSKPSSLLQLINPFFPSSLVHPPSAHCSWWGTVPLPSCGVPIAICSPTPVRTAFHRGSLAKDQLILMKCLFSCQAPLSVTLQMLLPRPERAPWPRKDTASPPCHGPAKPKASPALQCISHTIPAHSNLHRRNQKHQE